MHARVEVARHDRPSAQNSPGPPLLQLLVLLGIQALALFVCARPLAWPAGWACVGLYADLAAIGAVILLPHHTELVVERSRGAAGGTRWDFWVTRLLLVATLAILGTAGLDHRWGPTNPLSTGPGQVPLIWWSVPTTTEEIPGRRKPRPIQLGAGLPSQQGALSP